MRGDADAEHEGGGLSPNARIVYVSTDMLPRWRLQKSLSLDNARYALDLGRRDIAAQNVMGARFAHLQILRIKAKLKSRITLRTHEDDRLNQRVLSLYLANETVREREPEVAPEPAEKPAKRTRQVATHPSGLAPREIEVAKLVALDQSNATMAATLNTSYAAIATSVCTACKKLNLGSRAALGEWARKNLAGGDACRP